MIAIEDIVWLESEVMSDAADGGGRRTSRVVPDNVAGNLFPKISRTDATRGRVNLRKVYGAVRTANVDVYAGAHAIVMTPPASSKVKVTLFSSGSSFDRRSNARDHLEAYMAAGPESRMILVGRQLPGQRSIMIYQRIEEPFPEVGDVLCLSNEVGGITSSQQYVRVEDVIGELRNFEDASGVFQRRVLTISLGQVLRYEFSGPETPSRLSTVARSSRVRETTVVDAAQYFGIAPLSQPATAGDMSARVASVYTQIVPTTTRETPLSAQSLADAGNLLAAGERVSEALGTFAVGQTRYLRRSALQGELTLSGAGMTTVSDTGDGSISNSSFVGTVDYASGAITRTGGTASSSVSVSASYIPAAEASQVAHTMDIVVSLATRGTVYPVTLNPPPAPGTLAIDYRAQGKWYRLRDDGGGNLAGSDPAYGSGVVDYVSGAVVPTLGALPDVGTSVLFSWGSAVHFTQRAGAASDAGAVAKQAFVVMTLPVAPGSLSGSYESSNVQYAFSVSSAGVLAGDGVSGRFDHATGRGELIYSIRLPDPDAALSLSFNQVTPDNPSAPVLGDVTVPSAATMQLGVGIEGGGIFGGWVNGEVYFSGDVGGVNFHGLLAVSDDGAGVLLVRSGQRLSPSSTSASARVAGDPLVGTQAIGTINYVSGEVQIPDDIEIVATLNTFAQGESETSWQTGVAGWVTVGGGPATWRFKRSGVAATNEAITVSIGAIEAPLRIDLLTTVTDSLVPGALMFSLGGMVYVDRAGVLYSDISASTGAGTLAGALDTSTGVATLTLWSGAASPVVGVLACLTRYGTHAAWALQFRVPGAPLRPGSMFVQVLAADGESLSATCNDSGVLSHPEFSGTVDQDTGVVRLVFGKRVPAAGNESQPWFNTANVSEGEIFRPRIIQPATLGYNAVVLSNLPLNADLLGLDPVRLPVDGRVPIYRPGNIVVIHNTQRTELPIPLVPGSTHALSRDALAAFWLEDASGERVSGAAYLADLDNGTVSIANDFVVGDLVMPLTAVDVVEDMTMLTDVQINGELTFNSSLSRDYAAGETYVSSALDFGDLYARVTNVFDLLTFTDWSDTPGTGATAQFNNIDYPIEVFNNSTPTERWRCHFTSSTAFQVIGENLGVVATGVTFTDCTVLDPLTGQVMLIIRAGGWGVAGWPVASNLRFNTIGAFVPVWVVRTILPGAPLGADYIALQLRGDVDEV